MSLHEGYLVALQPELPSHSTYSSGISRGCVLGPVIYGWPPCESFIVVIVAPIWQAEFPVGSRVEFLNTTKALYPLVV